MLCVDKFLTSLILVPAADAITDTVRYKEIDNRHVLPDGDIRVGLHLRYKELRDVPAGGVASRMKYALAVMSALQTERELAVLGVELHALADYLLDTLRTFLHQHFHSLVLAQTASCDYGIGKMDLRIVLDVRHGGYTALGIIGVAVPQSLFSNHQDRPVSRCLMSGVQSRQSGAYDQIFPHLTRIYVLIKMLLRGSRRAAP